MYDVDVAVANLHRGGVITAVQLNKEMQRNGGVQIFYRAPLFLQKTDGVFETVPGDRLQHLHLPLCVAGQSAQRAGRLNAGHAAGIGDPYTAHVFDDVAAALGHDPIGITAQHGSRLGGGIGQRNRLCAAHGGDQLLLQDCEKIRLDSFVQHAVPPLMPMQG